VGADSQGTSNNQTSGLSSFIQSRPIDRTMKRTIISVFSRFFHIFKVIGSIVLKVIEHIPKKELRMGISLLSGMDKNV
jgi:hypothetical protein